MNIGLISVNDKPTTKMACGGTEVFVSDLAEELVNRGHNVTIFAGGDSYVNGCTIVNSTSHSLADIQNLAYDDYHTELSTSERANIGQILAVRNILTAKQYENEIDVFHDNSGSSIIASMLDLFHKPVVSTLHMPISLDYQLPCINRYLSHSNVHYIAISDYQMKNFPIAEKRIYNGTEIVTNNTASQQHRDLVWVGRIDPDTPKGLEDAIQVSKITGYGLKYVGFIENEAYYRNTIMTVLHDNVIRKKQFQTRKEKDMFYQEAKVSLIPVKCEESFGLTYIESMAAGTPVITYARGAAPEIIKDGKTGFLINPSESDIRGNYLIKQCGIAGLIEAVNLIYSLSDKEYETMRCACKKHISENFSLKNMVDRYEKLYHTLHQEYDKVFQRNPRL